MEHSNSPCSVRRRLFAGGPACGDAGPAAGPAHRHPYDEFPYTFVEGATQSEHRTALMMAFAAWLRDADSGARGRLGDLAAIFAHEDDTETDIHQYVIDICTRVLTDKFYLPVSTAETVAAGFVTEERFVDPDVVDDCGVTVRELWEWSPLDGLREAGTLTDADGADSSSRAWISLDHEVSVTGPLWLWLAAATVVVTYCWLVAMLVGRV